MKILLKNQDITGDNHYLKVFKTITIDIEVNNEIIFEIMFAYVMRRSSVMTKLAEYKVSTKIKGETKMKFL